MSVLARIRNQHGHMNMNSYEKPVRTCEFISMNSYVEMNSYVRVGTHKKSTRTYE